MKNRVGLLVLAIAALLPSSVYSNGEHGGATSPEGGIPRVSVHGYHVELLTTPSPVRVGMEARIV
ncbi:MAG TPA: hypothetical protein VFF86_00350, partial [Candidatus Methylomirabilis sp.]|nr:hypothetical protein [Candidatus Methylomirabilis sp.]